MPIKKLGQGSITNGSRKNSNIRNSKPAFSFISLVIILKLKYINIAYTKATTKFCTRNLAPNNLKISLLSMVEQYHTVRKSPYKVKDHSLQKSSLRR